MGPLLKFGSLLDKHAAKQLHKSQNIWWIPGWSIMASGLIVPFHNDISLAVSSPNTLYELMSYYNQLPVV